MPGIHPISLAVGVLWAVVVALALLTSDLSASAGILPDPWVGAGIAGGFLFVGLVVVGAWNLPETWPRLVRRRIQFAGMAGALRGMGTLTRAIYALVA